MRNSFGKERSESVRVQCCGTILKPDRENADSPYRFALGQWGLLRNTCGFVARGLVPRAVSSRYRAGHKGRSYSPRSSLALRHNSQRTELLRESRVALPSELHSEAWGRGAARFFRRGGSETGAQR